MTKTTKIVNRRWHLPPTQRTSPIQPSCSIVFAVGFIITYWTLLQKESSNWLLLVEKLVGGSTDRAWSRRTNWQKRYYGFLPRAHFFDEKGKVARLFLQYGSIGDNEPTCKNNRATWLFWWSYVRRRQLPSSILWHTSPTRASPARSILIFIQYVY